MTAISSASAALAASIRGDAQPPLYVNTSYTPTINQLVTSAATKGPNDVIAAAANVATPSIAQLQVASYGPDVTASVFAAVTQTGADLSSLVKNSTDSVARFAQQDSQPFDTSPLKKPEGLDEPLAKPVVDAADPITITPPADKPVVVESTGSNNNNTNTDTVTTTSTYTAATGAYTAAASFTASASASGGGSVSVRA